MITNQLATILVIDDEAAIRQSCSDYLEDQNFTILTAENGRIGVDLIKQEHPDVVLVDLRMPEMDGIEVLKQSKKFAPDMPIIVISGANSVGDAVRALRYGAWDYIVKPINDMSILEHSVNKALEKSRLLQENKKYQEHLEELVQERTHDLEQANIHLSEINIRLKKIVETTQCLSGITEIQKFSSSILDEFARHMVATGGSLYLAREDGLYRMHSIDPGHAPDFISFPLQRHSVFFKVMEEGKPLLVNNISNNKTIQPSGWNGYKDGSLLVLPIPDSKGKTVGILTLHNKVNPPFLEQDKEIGSILASYSSETLRSVRSFEALQESENKYRTLFEKTNDAIFIVEKKTGLYLDANDAAFQMTGRSKKELCNLTLKDISSDDSDGQAFDITDIQRAKELGVVTYYRLDGSTRIARLSAVPLNNISVIIIARDITHDLEVEKQLRQSQKMEAIGTLAGGIAHDFNNILSGIFGYSQLAEMDIHNPEKIKKDIDQIVKGAKRATGLVQQILTFSRQTEYKKNPLKLFLIVKEAVKFLRSSIPATIEIQEIITSQAMVSADPTQIHQVVMNLCTNAYHAMQDSGGTLTVELSDVTIQAHDHLWHIIQRTGEYVKLEITDTGHGMDKTTIEKIFDPYFTTKKLDQGTGLGLAVVDGIIKKHNGFIKASSKPGLGATFQIFLPVINRPEGNSTFDLKKEESQGGIETIMLVDDEDDLLTVSRLILKAHGYSVKVFRDGYSALQNFKQNPNLFDIIITDMTMPQMTGAELSRQILEIKKDIPIILCTGYSENFTEDMAEDLGITAYVQKPITGDNLSSIVRKLLDK